MASAYLGLNQELIVSDASKNEIVVITMRNGEGLPSSSREKEEFSVFKKNPPKAFDKLHDNIYKIYNPHSARVDHHGNIIVVDSGNNRILKYTKDGQFARWIGATNSGVITMGWQKHGQSARSQEPGGFIAPTSVAFDRYGNFVTSEYGNPRIQLFSGGGKFLGWFGGKSRTQITAGWEKEGVAYKGSKPGYFSESYGIDIKGKQIVAADSANRRIQIISLPLAD